MRFLGLGKVSWALAIWTAVGTVMVLGAQPLRRPGAGGSTRPSAEDAGGVRSAVRPAVVARKITGVARRDRVMTPQYSTSVSRGTEPAREWGAVALQYETQPEWIDELTVRFFVLGVIPKDGRNAYSFYRREVTYIDVKKGRNHVADMYLRPSALERFGLVAAVAAEIVVNGEVVAQLSESSMGDQIPPDWWKNEKVLKSESMTIRDGYLINRHESPFAYINVDDHEAIK